MLFLVTVTNGLILYIFYLYGWYRLDRKKIDLYNIRNYFAAFIFIILGALINIYISHSIKMFLVTVLIVFLANWVVFNDTKKSIVATILLQFITMISEAVIVLILNFAFSINIAEIMKNNLYSMLLNLTITIFNIILVTIPIVNKLFDIIIKFTWKLKKSKLIKYSLIMLFFATIFTSMIYMKQSFELIVTVNTMAIVIFCWLAIKMTNSEARYDETVENYKTSKSLLQKTENEMNEYMANNHEIKRELQIIEQMVLDNDPSVIEYVQALKERDKAIDVENDIKEQIEKIPLKLLRYLLKDRITECFGINIKFNFYISKRLKKSRFLKINKQDELDICDIASVFIGNAIEAIENTNKKDILFELYPDESFVCLVISNNYEGNISIDKISTTGYTTKGKGHGYGLSLVKKIVKKNKKLTYETEISKKIFKQTLKIKV